MKTRVPRVSLALILMLALALLVPATGAAQSSVDLVVNYVEGTPSETAVAYDMQVYLSVVDGDGNPIKDLTVEDFTVNEDSQQVELDSVDLADEQPIHIVLILDTSGSMVGQAITASRQAANGFVEDLNEGDNVAVISFNHIVTTEADFTTDHQAVQERISLINALPNAGTCMYDAVWQAVQMTASVPSGRRAVILLTDGVDEYNNQPCSSMTADDVIDAAANGGTRVPLYTIGLGVRVDQQGLTRMSTLTGGRFLYSPGSEQLDDMFQLISDQLRSQYVLSYTSYAAPGAHTLAVSVDYAGNQDQDSRSFLLPDFPTRVSFRSPLDGDQVGGKLMVEVAVTGQGEPVSQVILQVDEETIASDATTPYEMEVDFSQFEEGELTLTAIVQGADDVEIARSSINLEVTAAIAGEEEGGEESTETGLSSQTLTIGGIALGVLVLAGLLFVLLGGRKKRGKERARQAAWEQAQTIEETVAPPAADRTMDDWEPTPNSLGILLVEASDDPGMIGHRFEMSHSPVTLGRSADNDLNFPKDSPVSRHHAEITSKAGALFLSEVQSPDESGQMKGPKFGTFLDEAQISGAALLRDGAVIRLGKRVRLKFAAPARPAGSDEKTMDDIETGATADELPAAGNDPDATVIEN